jgi:membrane fusion protein, multidrug efflux system
MADASPAEFTAAATSAEAPVVVAPSKRARLLRILGIVVVVAALLWGIWYYVTQAGRVETDNAYVGADTAQVTALISGPVAEVRVGGTQMVKKGDVLVVLDPADAKVDVATAEAALFQAQQRYGQASAQVGSARAKLASRGADIAQARARVAEANAGYERARVELARREALAGSGAVSADELSAARAAFATARASRELASAGVASAEATSLSASSDLTATEALTRGTSISTAPDVAAARARLDAARLNLERTVIRAPIDGVVTNRQVQIGQRIAAGAPIMTIVPTATAYVDANFKESQLRRVRVGMPVELTSDFYGSDVVYHGKVTGFAGGTGAAFALIPAQNATGNWVKVVQRLPVRITLDPKELRDHPLRVGLTMTATIDARGK